MKSDDRGLLSMPVKIAVSMAVICAMAPMIMSLMDSVDDGMETAGAELQAEIVKDALGRAWNGGLGTVVSVNVSLSGNESMEIGGDEPHAIRVLIGGELRGRVYLDNIPVGVLGSVSVSGDRTVTAECAVIDGMFGLRVSA